MVIGFKLDFIIDFTSEEQSWERMPEFEKKFKEIFGDGSLKKDRIDSELTNADRRRIRHYKRLPEFSSAPIDLFLEP